MTEYHGSHGTSRSRAAEIARHGFTLSKDQVRRSKAVYLWKKCRNWTVLAKGWYRQQASRGRLYARDADSRGVVLYALATVPTVNYIDLCDQEAIDAIDEIADIANIDKSDREQIAAVYERYLQETERRLGNPIDIYETEVAPPDPVFCQEYSIKLLGAPRCYCVRKPAVLRVYDSEETE